MVICAPRKSISEVGRQAEVIELGGMGEVYRRRDRIQR